MYPTQALVGQMASIKSDRKIIANRLNELASVDCSITLGVEESVDELALA